MTPVRTPDVVRGDVPGLLCRGMPIQRTVAPEDDAAFTERALVVTATDRRVEVAVHDQSRGRGITTSDAFYWDVDWSDRAAIYLCLAWLADRGHICLWMLPITHGGRVEAWEGLTAWEVSAILVSRSVVRVARGLGPVTDLVAEECWGSAGCMPGIARYLLRSQIDGGLHYSADVGRRYNKGPRIDERATMVPKALADGCALLTPGGLLVAV